MDIPKRGDGIVDYHVMIISIKSKNRIFLFTCSCNCIQHTRIWAPDDVPDVAFSIWLFVDKAPWFAHIGRS